MSIYNVDLLLQYKGNIKHNSSKNHYLNPAYKFYIL